MEIELEFENIPVLNNKLKIEQALSLNLSALSNFDFGGRLTNLTLGMEWLVHQCPVHHLLLTKILFVSTHVILVALNPSPSGFFSALIGWQIPSRHNPKWLHGRGNRDAVLEMLKMLRSHLILDYFHKNDSFHRIWKLIWTRHQRYMAHMNSALVYVLKLIVVSVNLFPVRRTLSWSMTTPISEGIESKPQADTIKHLFKRASSKYFNSISWK